MSSNDKNAWRNSNSHRQQPAARGGTGTSTSTSTPTSTPTPSAPRPRPESANYSQAAKGTPSPAAPPTTNAWADRAKNAAAAKQTVQIPRKPTPSQSPAPASAGSPAPASAPAAAHNANKHVSVKQFNAGEVQEYFRKGYTASTAGDLATKALYRPATETKKAAGNPWGAKAQNMSNGQSFWTQLSKQINAAERGRGG